MLDDLRNSSSFIDEDEVPGEGEVQARPVRAYRRQPDTFMGMTAPQRFILSLLLFLMVFILGIAALIATDSIFLPF